MHFTSLTLDPFPRIQNGSLCINLGAAADSD